MQKRSEKYVFIPEWFVTFPFHKPSPNCIQNMFTLRSYWVQLRSSCAQEAILYFIQEIVQDIIPVQSYNRLLVFMLEELSQVFKSISCK